MDFFLFCHKVTSWLWMGCWGVVPRRESIMMWGKFGYLRQWVTCATSHWINLWAFLDWDDDFLLTRSISGWVAEEWIFFFSVRDACWWVSYGLCSMSSADSRGRISQRQFSPAWSGDLCFGMKNPSQSKKLRWRIALQWKLKFKSWTIAL